jgi:hypothetical protein
MKQGSSLGLANANVLELRPHRLSGVQLQRDDPFLQRQFRVVVGEVQNQPVVEVVLDVIPLRDDDDVVPIIELEEFFVPCGVDQIGFDELLAVRLPGGLLTDQADATRPRLPSSS